MNKIRVAVLFGGTNTEHEVSLVSARSIIKNLNNKKYIVTPVKIEKNGTWTVNGRTKKTPPDWRVFDIVFPVLHGPFGEDGTIQGMLEVAHVAYVGCGVLASALCMDKVVQKQLCTSYGLPIVKHIWATDHEWQIAKRQILKRAGDLKLPLFVKPANQGSSVGITRVGRRKDLVNAIEHALKLDRKVLIEEGVHKHRNIECSVLGNEEPKAAPMLAEIIASNEFYDYDAKYVDGKSQEIIGPRLQKKLEQQIRQTAVEAYKLLDCEGMARVDFLVNGKTGEYYLSELNTIPGFTSISMYPKLWEASGLSYPRLLDRLIDLALDRHRKRSQILLDYTPKKDWFNE